MDQRVSSVPLKEVACNAQPRVDEELQLCSGIRCSSREELSSQFNCNRNVIFMYNSEVGKAMCKDLTNFNQSDEEVR